MIKEIVDYMEYAEENLSSILKEGEKVTKGLHIFVQLDEDGNPINFPGEKGVDWDYYDGEEKSEFIRYAVDFDKNSTYITINKQKGLDPKNKIFSASPFAFSFNFNFNNKDKEKYGIKKLGRNATKEEREANNLIIKKQRVKVILEIIDKYFENVAKHFELDEDDKKIMMKFKAFIKYILPELNNEENYRLKELQDFWFNLKDKKKDTEYIKIYLKNISLKKYKKVYASYLKNTIFNKNKYNLKIKDEVYGVINYLTTFNDDKAFLKHRTSFLKDGISYRFTIKDAKLLNLFSSVQNSLPNPLPLFIDKAEFRNLDEMIIIYKENSKLSYSQILKKMFETNENRVLENYYLLFFIKNKNGSSLRDFDYVEKFQFSLKENGEYPKILNLFTSSKNNIVIYNIFDFESKIVRKIFNNSLVKIKENKNSYTVNYFNDIDANYVVGGDVIYNLILKYRKAFYDYIYKSRRQSILAYMWDDILWNSILADLRRDKITNGYHTQETTIKEKLNIWFSLYNYFYSQERRENMASRIPELLEKIRKVANDDNEHLTTEEEFAFAAGQIIYFLLSKSRSSEKTHALLEPFIQKTQASQLQEKIVQTINLYKHELSFNHGKFEMLAKEVLAFETDKNLKPYQKFLLSGYFSKPVIYESNVNNEKNNEEEENE